jgi:hypothetical protein
MFLLQKLVLDCEVRECIQTQRFETGQCGLDTSSQQCRLSNVDSAMLTQQCRLSNVDSTMSTRQRERYNFFVLM